MHVKTKQMAYLSLMAACSVMLVFLGTMIESNTLFFTAAASFLVGAAIAMSGPRMGMVFYATCLVLGVILLPNKMYCFTYGAFGIYIIVREIVRAHMSKAMVNWVIRYMVFNVIFIPAVILVPGLFISVTISWKILLGLIVGGQVALFILDRAYEWFMRNAWTPFYGRIK